MSLKLYEETDIQAIADATRAKTGTTDKYKVSQMPQAIADIEVGGSGNDGATFTPSVSADGLLSWTNDKGLPNPESVNIKGVQGERGIQGEKGDKGDKGDKGEQGIQGIQGLQGERGADGQDGADGYTPVKGIDYWTADDKSEINAYIDNAIGTLNTALEARLNGGADNG